MKEDLRQALRAMARKPGFSAVAVLTLAFGIGVNVSLFSIVNTFFFQSSPLADPHELVVVMQRGELIGLPYGHSYPDYLDYREGVAAFQDLAAHMPTAAHLSAPGEAAERTWIEVVSPNYFALARVKPSLGALFRPGEGESKGAAPEVVLSHAFWQRRFAADPAVLGQPIHLNGRPFTVIGIAPAEFTGLSFAMAVSAFVPAGAAPSLMDSGEAMLTSRRAPAWRLMGRLRPGQTVEAARSEIQVVAARLLAEYPEEHKGTKPLVIPENRARPDPSVSDFMPVFAVIFMGMVVLVLVIACANVANLILSRSLVRLRDLALRSALGASRYRIVRLQVAESVVLALLAGVLGLALAYGSGLLLARLAPSGDIPVTEPQPWDLRVYFFTLLVSLAAGIGTGLWPALKASRFDLGEMVKEGSAQRLGSSRHRLRNTLVMGQVTMSLVVLVCAAFFAHSLRQLQVQALGFRTDHLVMASLDLGLQRYDDERGRRFLEQLQERASALPGVSSATLASHVPLDTAIQMSEVAIDGEVPGAKDGRLTVSYNAVGPGFFETAEVRLVRGRRLERHDRRESAKVAVVNETMARTLWPRQEALGQRFRFGRDGEWLEVVGVAADGKYVMLAEEPRPYFFVPLEQRYRSPVTLMARTAVPPEGVSPAIQGLLRELDPDLPVFNVRTMDRHVRDSVFGLMPFRMGATLAGAQGAISLLLAVLGLYAVVSYAVNQRTREIAVRLALGAQPSHVLRLVMRDGLRLTLTGCAVGLVVALGVGFGLSRVLYGVNAVDPAVVTGVTLLLVLVAAVACYVPAARATRVDPLVALRSE
jgi:predicted permease